MPLFRLAIRSENWNPDYRGSLNLLIFKKNAATGDLGENFFAYEI